MNIACWRLTVQFNLIIAHLVSTLDSAETITNFAGSSISRNRSFKEYLRKNILKANMIIDVLVDKAKNMGLFKDIEMPTQFSLPYKQDISSTRNTMRAEGVITGIGSITRPTDWSLYETEKERLLYGYMRIKDYKFTYDYRTEYMNTIIAGTIKATIYKAKFSMELRFLKDHRDCLGAFRSHISELNDIEVDIAGLGSLGWVESRIRSIVLGHIRWETRNKVGQFLMQQLTTAYSSLNMCDWPVPKN